MYETKRTNALKTLDKKQTKVEEINKVRANQQVGLKLAPYLQELELV